MTDSRSDLVDQLGKLASLRDSGALSEAEFEVAKAKVLGTSPTETAKSVPRTGGSAVGPAVQVPEDNNLMPAQEEGWVWNCTGCGKANGVARATCWFCGGTRDAAQARPWEEADGRVMGVVSTPWAPGPSVAAEPWSPEQPSWEPARATRESTWAPLWLSLLVFAPIGFVMALWRLTKHYGAYREGIALLVSSAQLVVAIILVVVALGASPPSPSNGGYYNTSVLAPSVQQVTNQHYQKLGMGIKVTSTNCVLDYGSTFTCALHETASGVPLTLPITVVVSDNGNEWKSS